MVDRNQMDGDNDIYSLIALEVESPKPDSLSYQPGVHKLLFLDALGEILFPFLFQLIVLL